MDTDVIVKCGVAAVVAKAANDHFRAVYGIDAFGTIRRFLRRVVDDLRRAVPRRGGGKFTGRGRKVGKKKR